MEVGLLKREIVFCVSFLFDYFPYFKADLAIRRGTTFLKINVTSEWGIFFFYTLDNFRISRFSYQSNLKTVLNNDLSLNSILKDN